MLLAAYQKTMSQPGMYGTELELSALSRRTQRPMVCPGGRPLCVVNDVVSDGETSWNRIGTPAPSQVFDPVLLIRPHVRSPVNCEGVD